MMRRVLLALTAVVSAMPAWAAAPSGGTDGARAALVAAGKQWWARSPDHRNPVACATCHHDPALTRGWAASFPKFKPLPPPDGRVMTLLQATAEAVRRHYGLVDPEPVAVAIAAFLDRQGAGLALSPGVAAGQPVFETRLRALAASVARGRTLYVKRCGDCHDAEAVAAAALPFPRVVDSRAESLERFLERHRPIGRRLSWDSPATADLIAFLVSTLAGPRTGGETSTNARASSSPARGPAWRVP
jgi:cytochrome c553